jgi:anti-anti-sigma factor
MVIEIKHDNDICILRITGRLAAGENIEYLRTKTKEIKQIGCRKLVADIRELKSVGSLGVGFFVDLYTSMNKDGLGCFVLAGTSPRVQEVLVLTRLATIIPMAEDLTAGIAFLAAGNKTRASGS